jgi:hypothetical protein
MARSSCLCGAVAWELGGPFTSMTHCHCSMCRKAHGAAFSTIASARREQFHWLAGVDLIARYRSSAALTRNFCARCGSVVPGEGPDGEDMDLPAGCFDDDPVTRPSRHIFVASKAPWDPIEDDLPRHVAWMPGFDAPLVADRTRAGPQEGVLRGNCLCGAIAYEVVEPLRAVHNCHCSRCRKARAAAYTTNGFTSIEGVRFVRGENEVATYKLPEARFFTHAFCRTCGSGVPRLDPERAIAIIPLGSLDDDPGRGADDHIYVASKAPWYDIPGDLPRYAERPGG